MNYEMSRSFDRELLMITLLTAVTIFIVVLLTFRSLAVPAILVLLVQCGVFITVTVVGFQGYSMLCIWNYVPAAYKILIELIYYYIKDILHKKYLHYKCVTSY